VIVATAPPTPEPTLNPAMHIGQSVPTTTGAVITVVQTAAAQSGNQFETPPPGGAWFAAEVKECAGTQTTFVSASAWSVKLADSTQVDGRYASEMSPAPELASTNLNPNSCTDGWVYFPLPAGAAPKEIHLLRADFYWTL
jgi:hypothetical protein